jgi:hypothetical protein
MNAFNYIIAKREPSAECKAQLEAAFAAASADAASATRSASVIPLPNGLAGCVVVDALTRAECAAVVTASEAAGFTFWSDPASGDEQRLPKASDEESVVVVAAAAAAPSGKAVARADTDAADVRRPGGRFRTAHTIEVNLPTLARTLWQRVSPFVATTVTIDQSDEETYERALEGTWHATGFCENLLFARYGAGGHFAPHVDGMSVLDFNRRSMYSALFYLTDLPLGGGETIFHRGDQCHAVTEDPETGKVTGRAATAVFAWPPRPGSCTVFRHDVLHEGAPVAAVPDSDTAAAPANVKYIIRGDVLFERRPPLCDDDAGRRAFAMFERARTLEAEGDTDGAVREFRAMRRLSPQLAELLRLA